MSGSPSPHNPTVNVNLPRRGSSLGMASLVLGVIAFTICWIPFLGILGIPLSGLGVFLGLVGLVVAATRKGSGIGFPIAGTLVCGIALIVAISLNYAIAEGIDQAGKSYAEARRQAELDNQIGASSRFDLQHASETAPHDGQSDAAAIAQSKNETPQTETASDINPSPTTTPTDGSGSPTAEKLEPEPEWTPADHPLVLGDVRIRIISVIAGLVPLEGIGGATGTSQEPALRIQVEVTNQSQSRKIDYETLVGPSMGFKKHCAQLQDNFGNDYNRISYGFSTNAAGQTKQASIYPGKSITDVLVFEPPIDSIEYLDLTLPLKSVGMDGTAVIRISQQLINTVEG